jgi:microcompartment protein CcmL/EutN
MLMGDYTEPALALLEFSSIAVGLQAADAMVKKAPVSRVASGTVQPGKYLVMIAGEVAEVEESRGAGLEIGEAFLLDQVFLPAVHLNVVSAIVGNEKAEGVGEAIGVIETLHAASCIQAADAGVKGAEVDLRHIRLADGLGGKGFCIFQGIVSDVEAAVEIGVGSLPSSEYLVQQVVIPQLHLDVATYLNRSTAFGALVWLEGGIW